MVEPAPSLASWPTDGLHVLILDPAFHEGSGPGSTRTFDLATRLATSGHKVTALTTTWGWDPASDFGRRRVAIREIGGVTVRARCLVPHGGMKPTAEHTSTYVRWAALQMWQVADVDVILASAEPYGLLPCARFFAFWRGIPLLADARTVAREPLPAGATTTERLNAMLGNGLRRFALKLPRRIFAASQAVVTSLTADGVEPERQSQTMLGCDTRLFTVPPGRDSAFLQEYPDLAGRPLLVFAGHFTPDRDLIAVVNLAAALREWSPDVAVVLCGDGPTRITLENHARTVGVLDNALRIMAPLPRRQLPDLLAAATMVLSIPAHNDTAGGLFDALAAGRPVLAFGNNWQRSLVESRGAGYGLPPGDPRAVAREVVEILRDTDGLRRAGQQAAALAAGRFNLERIISEQRAILETLVAETPRAEVLRRRALRAKRGLDIFVSLAGLIILLPVIVVLIVAIGIKLGWPPIIAAERVGLKGRSFKSVRFRSTADTDDGGDAFAEKARITTFGAFLRASGLALLPELINVLRGTMSLVGPKPLPPSYVTYFTPAQRRRHEMRPGLTGLAQIERDAAATWEGVFSRDLAYVDQFTFWRDCKILLRTLFMLLQGKHASLPPNIPAFDAIMARRQGAEDI